MLQTTIIFQAYYISRPSLHLNFISVIAYYVIFSIPQLPNSYDKIFFPKRTCILRHRKTKTSVVVKSRTEYFYS